MKLLKRFLEWLRQDGTGEPTKLGVDNSEGCCHGVCSPKRRYVGGCMGWVYE